MCLGLFNESEFVELSLEDDVKAEDAKRAQDTDQNNSSSSQDVDPSLLTKMLTTISGVGTSPVPGFKMKNHLSLDDGGATPRNSMAIDIDTEQEILSEQVEERAKPQRQASKFELSHRYSKF